MQILWSIHACIVHVVYQIWKNSVQPFLNNWDFWGSVSVVYDAILKTVMAATILEPKVPKVFAYLSECLGIIIKLNILLLRVVLFHFWTQNKLYGCKEENGSHFETRYNGHLHRMRKGQQANSYSWVSGELRSACCEAVLKMSHHGTFSPQGSLTIHRKNANSRLDSISWFWESLWQRFLDVYGKLFVIF